MGYPVSVEVSPLVTGRNRLTTAFRLLLAIPHLVLVGGAGFGFGASHPPFGDGPYTAALEVTDPPIPRNRLTVALRLILAIPHIVVLLLVLLGWTCTTIVAWFSILLTGAYPRALYGFGVGALRWRLRLEAYMLLMVDDYPPFSLT
jgi:hypothetical protein